MAHFDGITDASFKTDSQGNLLFYRWGVFGRGYVLPDDPKRQKVRHFVKAYYTVTLPGAVLFGAVFGWIISLALLPFIFAWYSFATGRLLRGLSISSTRLTLRENYANSARSHSLGALWFMLITSILFVLAGFMAILIKEDVWFLGLLSIVLTFGVSALTFAYMIKIKNT